MIKDDLVLTIPNPHRFERDRYRPSFTNPEAGWNYKSGMAWKMIVAQSGLLSYGEDRKMVFIWAFKHQKSS